MESRAAGRGSCRGSLSRARPLHLVSGLKLLAVGEGGGEDRPAPGGHTEPGSGLHRRGLSDTADLWEELALAALEGPSLGARGSCTGPGRSPGAALTAGRPRCLSAALPRPSRLLQTLSCSMRAQNLRAERALGGLDPTQLERPGPEPPHACSPALSGLINSTAASEGQLVRKWKL